MLVVDLPEDIKFYILKFLDFKCIVCKKKIPFLEKHIIMNDFHFCSKECCKLFYIFPF